MHKVFDKLEKNGLEIPKPVKESHESWMELYSVIVDYIDIKSKYEEEEICGIFNLGVDACILRLKRNLEERETIIVEFLVNELNKRLKSE